jgi:hypothetical protein
VSNILPTSSQRFKGSDTAMKKTLIVLATLMFACLVVTPRNTVSQDQESTATLEETLGFLHDFVGSYGTFTFSPSETNHYTVRNTYTFKPVEKCMVEVADESRYQPPSGNYSSTLFFNFSLTDIDPFELTAKTDTTERAFARVGAGVGHGTFIQLSTTNHRKVVEYKIKWPNGDTDTASPMDSTTFGITDGATGENGKRVIKALKHAVKLCGGKVAPF